MIDFFFLVQCALEVHPLTLVVRYQLDPGKHVRHASYKIQESYCFSGNFPKFEFFRVRSRTYDKLLMSDSGVTDVLSPWLRRKCKIPLQPLVWEISSLLCPSSPSLSIISNSM